MGDKVTKKRMALANAVTEGMRKNDPYWGMSKEKIKRLLKEKATKEAIIDWHTSKSK